MQHGVRYTKAMLINSSLSHCYQGEMTLPISYGFLVALLKCNALKKKKKSICLQGKFCRLSHVTAGRRE